MILISIMNMSLRTVTMKLRIEYIGINTYIEGSLDEREDTGN